MACTVPRAHRDVDVVVGDDTGEALGDPAQLDGAGGGARLTVGSVLASGCPRSSGLCGTIATASDRARPERYRVRAGPVEAVRCDGHGLSGTVIVADDDLSASYSSILRLVCRRLAELDVA